MQTARRSAMKKLLASAAAIVGLGYSVRANGITEKTAGPEKEAGNVTDFQNVPLFSGFTRHGDLVYIAGKGAHVAPFEIKAHTEIVLKELEKELINAGSSMEKVLKVSVFLNDIADYKGMNEVYKGRFGKNPPVRTTVAVAKGGVPGDSLVEMDCIAYV
jgi:enamine deaminase RidA (YjgF/YER057c/UK114 family)